MGNANRSEEVCSSVRRTDWTEEIVYPKTTEHSIKQKNDMEKNYMEQIVQSCSLQTITRGKQVHSSWKRIDLNTELLILGYIRECQQLLSDSSNNSSFSCIPFVIIDICVCYSIETEYFCYSGFTITASNKNLTVRKIELNYNLNNTSFGCVWIPGCILIKFMNGIYLLIIVQTEL